MHRILYITSYTLHRRLFSGPMNNESQNGWKILPKLCENGSKIVPSRVQMAVGLQIGVGNASKAALDSKVHPIS